MGMRGAPASDAPLVILVATTPAAVQRFLTRFPDVPGWLASFLRGNAQVHDPARYDEPGPHVTQLARDGGIWEVLGSGPRADFGAAQSHTFL